jgi:hypothetical protein
MIKKYLFFLLYIPGIFSQISEKSQQGILIKIKDGVEVSGSILSVAQIGLKLAVVTKSYIAPDAMQQYKARVIAKQLHCLKAEEKLEKCLIKNARGQRGDNQIPIECNAKAELFAVFAGPEHLNTLKSEFVAAADKLHEIEDINKDEEKNDSISAVTTGVLIVGGIGLAIVAAPIVLPGTIIAAKATAITASVKGFFVAAGTKVIAGATVSKTLATGIVGTTLEIGQAVSGSAANVANLAIATVSKMPPVAQANMSIQAANLATSCVQKIRPYVFRTAEEELDYLYELKTCRSSLSERIKIAHEKNK